MRVRNVWLVAILLAMLVPGGAVRADTVEEDSVKAAYLLNFAKYAEWPATVMGGGELYICTLSAQALSGKLESLQEKQVQGKQIRLRTVTRASEWRGCHVLYLAADEEQRADTILRNLAQFPVLTVSDAPGFAQAGGIIGLKLRAGRIRFDINQGAARHSGLTLSSQLLKLADEVLP